MTVPDQDGSRSATRVIDGEFRVVNQNGTMAEWTQLDVSRGDVSCHSQLSCSLCRTDECPVRQLTEGEKRRIERQLDVTFPDGRTKSTVMIAERIATDLLERDYVAQTFKDVVGLLEQPDGGQACLTVPAPSDEESFRRALTQLLRDAESRGTSIGNQFWTCERATGDGGWDVEITRVPDLHRE